MRGRLQSEYTTPDNGMYTDDELIRKLHTAASMRQGHVGEQTLGGFDSLMQNSEHVDAENNVKQNLHELVTKSLIDGFFKKMKW